MAEHKLVFETEPAAAPAPPSPTPPPIPAAAPARPAVAAAPAGRTPFNNWLQPASYKLVTGKPPNFDHSRAPTSEAPHGFVDGGDPWSPYGTTKLRGAIRPKPCPEMEGRDPCIQAQGAAAGSRRVAAGDQKPVEDIAGINAAIDADYRHMCDGVAELKKRHPATKYGVPPHPKTIGEGAVCLTDPHFAPGGIADVIKGITGFLSRALHDPEAKPSQDTIDDAAKKISTASKYYGVSTDPKTLATALAVFAILFCLLPAIMSGGRKLIAAVRGKEEVKP